MPQPIWPDPPEGTFVYQPKVLLLERPGHAAAIGLVASEWAALEGSLIQAISFSLFATSKEGGYALARTALETIESVSIRLEVISELLKTRIPAADFTYFSETLRTEIRKRARERNVVVHSSWIADIGYPDYVITRSDGRYFKYSIKDFTDIADRIVKTTNDANHFLAKFHRWDGAGPWNSTHAPEPN